MADREVRDLARRLLQVERLLRNQKQPTLGYSSIDDGAITAVDVDGNLTQVIGKQFDGTHGDIVVTGPPPPAPNTPGLTPTLGGVLVYWDGTFPGQQIAPMDWSRVTIHAYPAAGFVAHDPTDQTHIVGTFTSALGGEQLIGIPKEEHVFFLVSWSRAGKFSDPSGGAVATPASITMPDLADVIDEIGETAGGAKIHWENYAPTAVPTPGTEGELWWHLDNDGDIIGVYHHRGGVWVQGSLKSETLAELDAGKITFGELNGELIRSRSIKALSIEAGAIGALEANIGELWTEILRAGLIQAGFVLAGKIQVGEATWSPDGGLIIPQPDGGTITLPANGVDQAVITARIVATAMTVKDEFTIAGYGQVVGHVEMANGVTPPLTAPEMAAYWPTLAAPALAPGESSSNGHVFRGLVEHSSAQWAVAVNYFGAGIRLIDKVSGMIGVYPDPTVDKAWAANFYPEGGLTRIGTSYYLLGSDSTRSSDYYIYRISATTWEKTAEIKVGTTATFPRLPILCANPSGQVQMIWTEGGTTRLRRFPVDLAESIGTIALLSGGTQVDWAGAYHGPVGADGTHRLYLAPASGNLDVRCFTGDGVSMSETSTRGFRPAYGATLAGLALDSAAGKLVSVDMGGRLARYSDLTTAQTHYAASTFYDGDNAVYPAGTIIAGVDRSGQPSGTHESAASPVRSMTLPARSYLQVTAVPPPEEKIVDAARVDKANRVGIYASRTGTPTLQAYLPNAAGVAQRSMVIDVPTTGGQAAPTVNGFVGAAVPVPGKITSTARRLDGRPRTHLDGAAVADRADGLVPPGGIQLFAMAALPNGWLVCDGALYSTATYPDLFAAIGYTWGGSGTTFRVPDLRRRFLWGADTSRPVGSTDPTSSVAGRTPFHTHGGSTLSSAAATSSGATTSPGTSAGNVPTAASFNGHTHGITGSTGGGLSIDSDSGFPNAAVVMGIRT